MKKLKGESIDLIVTSPPYDNLRTYNGTNDWNFEVFSEIAKECSRVIKKWWVIVWIVWDATVKWSETWSSFRQALYFKDECWLNLHDTMIWDKWTFTAVGSLKTRYAPVYEFMFILSKGKPTFNPIKDKKNKTFWEVKHSHARQKDGTMKPLSSLWKPIAEYWQRHNIWEMPNVWKSWTKHPATFPEKLAEDHIISWSNEWDTILDPFMWSWTTWKMALLNNREFIGIERVEEYFNIAKERIWNSI
jgi:DNA modification methylase